MQSASPLFRLLAKKNIVDQDLFNRPYPLQLNDPIGLHAKWVFEHIYSIPYPVSKNTTVSKNPKIAREIHGIQHTSRVAMYVSVFANLYRRHGVEEANALSEEDIQLLQIAALFHDSARENEGTDEWDHESAILLYHYLTHTLKVDKAKAKLIAEATANKDWKAGKEIQYFSIEETDGKITGKFIPSPNQPKNIYQKIIHDADCLDIIRARACFDAKYLDFYNDIANNNTLAFEEMAHLIIEARSLIHLQGDSFGRIHLATKQEYECPDAYTKILQTVTKNPDRFPLLYQLGQGIVKMHFVSLLPPVLPYDEKVGMIEANVQAALREGKLLVRAVASPSAIMTHSKKTAAQVEIEKTYRTIGIATSSKKPDRMNKHGNDNRSVSVILATPAFSDAGFLGMLDQFNKKAISQISSTDWGSGRGKKKNCNNVNKKFDVEQELSKLVTCLKMGGATTRGGYTHTELLMCLTAYKAIYFSNDPNLYNNVLSKNSTQGMKEPIHQYAPILQAIYLQKECEKLYGVTKSQYESTFGVEEGNRKFKERFGEEAVLPIFHYSAVDNTIIEVPQHTLTEEKIVEMWVAMCTDYIRSQLRDDSANKNECNIYTMDISQIKTCSMYGRFEGIPDIGIEKHAPADVNYPDVLVKKINHCIEQARVQEIKEYQEELIVKLEKSKDSLIDSLSFVQAYLHCNSQEYFYSHFKDRMMADIQAEMQPERFKNHIRKLNEEIKKCNAYPNYKNNNPYYKNKDSWIYKMLLPIYNLSQLAKKIEAQECVAQIQLHVKNTYVDILSKLTNDLSKDGSVSEDCLKISLKLIQVFDLPRTELELCIDTIINNLPVQFAKEYFSDCWPSITAIASCGLLTPEHGVIIESIYMQSKVHIKNRDNKYVYKLKNQFKDYLAFVKAINIEHSHIKEDIINYITLIVSWPGGMKELAEKYLYLLVPYLNDLDIFNHLINYIIYPVSDIEKKYQITHSLDNLIALQKAIPIFNEQQWNIIKQRWEKACLAWNNGLKKRINTQTDVGTIWKEHLSIIERAVNSGLPVSVLEDQLIEFLSYFVTGKMVTEDVKNQYGFMKSLLNDSSHKRLNDFCEKSSNPVFAQLIKEYNKIYQNFLDCDFSSLPFSSLMGSKKFSLLGCKLTPDIVKSKLLPFLIGHPEIESIDFSLGGLSPSIIDDKMLAQILPVLSELKNLTELDLLGNNIGDQALGDLICTLTKPIINFRWLDLSKVAWIRFKHDVELKTEIIKNANLTDEERKWLCVLVYKKIQDSHFYPIYKSGISEFINKLYCFNNTLFDWINEDKMSFKEYLTLDPHILHALVTDSNLNFQISNNEATIQEIVSSLNAINVTGVEHVAIPATPAAPEKHKPQEVKNVADEVLMKSKESFTPKFAQHSTFFQFSGNAYANANATESDFSVIKSTDTCAGRIF